MGAKPPQKPPPGPKPEPHPPPPPKKGETLRVSIENSEKPMNDPRCPDCWGKVEEIRQPQNSPLNRGQWESQLAGQYICRTCPSNYRGNQPLCYWWKSEVLRKEQFDSYYDANPWISDLFLRFVNELIVVGISKICVEEVIHRVRWELLTDGNYDLAHRLKILYGNRYVMELITKDDSYRKFFDLTELHSHD